MGPVRSGVNVEKHAQVHARLAVGSKAHHLPFIGVRNKAEKAGEHCVKQPERVRPADREDRVDAAFSYHAKGKSPPTRRAVHYHDGGIVKAGISIGTERMSKMVIHETKPRFRGTELTLEWISAAILMPHAGEMTRGVQDVEIADRPLERGIQLQVVTKRRARSLPADAHFVDPVRSNLGEIKTGSDREAGKAGVVGVALAADDAATHQLSGTLRAQTREFRSIAPIKIRDSGRY